MARSELLVPVLLPLLVGFDEADDPGDEGEVDLAGPPEVDLDDPPDEEELDLDDPPDDDPPEDEEEE